MFGRFRGGTFCSNTTPSAPLLCTGALDKEKYPGLSSSTCVKTWLKDGRTDLSRNARESYIYNNVWKTFPRKQVPWRNLLQQHHSRSAYALHRCFASVWALDKVENYHGLGSSTCVKAWLKDGRTDLSRNARESWTLAAHGRVHRTFSVATLWKSLALGDVLEQPRL